LRRVIPVAVHRERNATTLAGRGSSRYVLAVAFNPEFLRLQNCNKLSQPGKVHKLNHQWRTRQGPLSDSPQRGSFPQNPPTGRYSCIRASSAKCEKICIAKVVWVATGEHRLRNRVAPVLSESRTEWRECDFAQELRLALPTPHHDRPILRIAPRDPTSGT